MLFTSAVFLSAGLLFLVQPMVAKTLLPLLGGSPAVWNTCMVFFQVALLAGYVYAHLLSTRIPARLQWAVHLCVLGAGVAALPIALPAALSGGPESSDPPTLWLLIALAWTAGLPFFAVASAGPLLQRWFSRTGHRSAGDPYFLYAASNAGSMLGLLSYPLLVEPGLDLGGQAAAWAGGFVVFAVLALGCGVAASKGASDGRSLDAREKTERLSVNRRCWWVFLAFVPSSLLLGSTQHLSTDVAAVPLLWVLPLTLYLASFIVVFSSGKIAASVRDRWTARVTPYVMVGVVVLFTGQLRDPIWGIAAVHLVALSVLCVLCHGRLAEDRPGASRLTEFYLFMSLGGAMGGLFNALAAPLLFDDVHEYPIALALACLAMPAAGHFHGFGAKLEAWIAGNRVMSVPGAAFVSFVALMLVYLTLGDAVRAAEPQAADRVLAGAAALGIGLLLLVTRGTPAAMGAVVGSGLLFAQLSDGMRRVDVVYRERTFFGVHEVYDQLRAGPDGGPVAWRVLMHGTTIHGMEQIDAPRPTPPSNYYHPTGPLGEVMQLYMFDERFEAAPMRIGIVGLGVGATAAYARPGDTLRIFEIDPAVVRIATDPGLYTYVEQARQRGVETEIVIGDGRRELAREQDGFYDVLILDAFSSDAIPVHLLTQDAIAMYAEKLAPGGVMMFHISNRHLELGPVFAGAGAELGLAVRGKIDDRISEQQRHEQKQRSTWVAVARTEKPLETLLIGRGWIPLVDDEDDPVRWTDSYSNILDVLDW